MSRPKVLAACTTAIGDTMFCSPALEALSRSFEVDVLVHQKRRQLLVANPHIGRIYSYRNNPFNRALLATVLAKTYYQHVVVLHANDDLIKLLRLLRYGQALNVQGWDRPELKLYPRPRDNGVHAVDERLRLVQWVGAHLHPQDRFMRMYLLPGEAHEAEQWLLKRGMSSKKPRVGLVLGASAKFRRWPAERFGQVAAGLLDRNVQVITIGDSSENDLAMRAEKAAGSSLIRGHNLGLRLLASVLSRLDLVISNDTGPLHLGQAVGTPVIGLFGPTDPVRVGPRGPRDRVLKVPATCFPCTEKLCEDPFCMNQLETRDVMQAALQMLARDA